MSALTFDVGEERMAAARSFLLGDVTDEQLNASRLADLEAGRSGATSALNPDLLGSALPELVRTVQRVAVADASAGSDLSTRVRTAWLIRSFVGDQWRMSIDADWTTSVGAPAVAGPAGLSATRSDDGWRLDGAVALGALFASPDRVALAVGDEEGAELLLLDPTVNGAKLDPGEGLYGERALRHPVLTLTDVSHREAPVATLDPARWQELREALALLDELLESGQDLAAVKVALWDAGAYVRERAHRWFDAWEGPVSSDPLVLREVGRWWSMARAADGMLEDALADMVRTDDAATPSTARRAVVAARTYTARLCDELLSGFFELTGASAVRRANGLDRHWRDRTVRQIRRPAWWGYAELADEWLARVGAARPAARVADPRSTDVRYAKADGRMPEPIGANRYGAPTTIATLAQAFAAADDVAGMWAEGNGRWDETGDIPWAELEYMSHSGVASVQLSRELGGVAMSMVPYLELTAKLAVGDGTIAQLYYVDSGKGEIVNSLPPAGAEEIASDIHRGARFGNATAERSRTKGGSFGTVLRRDGDRYLMSGDKYFCTGAVSAHWIFVPALFEDGGRAVAVVPRDAAGLTLADDWDVIGQRATQSVSANFVDVEVPITHVVDRRQEQPLRTGTLYAAVQLGHTALQLGMAEGALNEVGRLLAARDGSATPSASDLDLIGRWCSELAAMRSVMLYAGARIDDALADSSVRNDKAEIAVVAVDEAKSIAYARGPALVQELVQFMTPGDDAAALRLDRFWRNIRTHSLHDPVRWRQAFVGDFWLNGKVPPDLGRRQELERTWADRSIAGAPDADNVGAPQL